jgi:hypothetical protein
MVEGGGSNHLVRARQPPFTRGLAMARATRSPFRTRKACTANSSRCTEIVPWTYVAGRRTALPDLQYADGETQSASRRECRFRVLGLSELPEVPRDARDLMQFFQRPLQGESARRLTQAPYKSACGGGGRIRQQRLTPARTPRALSRRARRRRLRRRAA